MQFNWSEWVPVESISGLDDPRLRSGGVYEVRLVYPHGTLLDRVSRLRPNPSPNGNVYIGCTVNPLRKRIRRIPRSRRHGKSGHTLGRKLHRLEQRPELRDRMGEVSLECRYAVCENARASEQYLFDRYWNACGELPPLNGTIDEDGVAAWLRSSIDGLSDNAVGVG